MSGAVLNNINWARKGRRAGAVLRRADGGFSAILTTAIDLKRCSKKELVTADEGMAREIVREWVKTGVLELNNTRRDDR